MPERMVLYTGHAKYPLLEKLLGMTTQEAD